MADTNVLSFDGNDSVSCGDHAGSGISNPSLYGALTVELWVNAQSGYYMVSSGGQTSSRGMAMSLTGCFLRDGAKKWELFGWSLPVGVWTHAAMVWDGTTLTSYVGGVQIDQVVGVASSDSDTKTLLELGKPNSVDDYFFTGKLSEIRFWNVARTQQEIQDNMNIRLAGTEPGLVAYYPLDEGSGTIATDEAGTKDGTIVGATWAVSDVPISEPSSGGGGPIRAYISMPYGDLTAANRARVEMIYSLLLDHRAITEMIYSLRLGAHVDMRYGDCPELRSVLNMHYSDCPLLRRALVMSYDDLLMHRHVVDMDYAIPRTLTQTMVVCYSIAEGEVRSYCEMSYDLLVNNPLRQALVMSYLMEGDTMVRQVVPDVTIGGRRVKANHLAPEPEWGFYAIPVEIHLIREADYVQVAIGEDVIVTLEGVIHNLVVDDKRESLARDTGSITWIVETLSPAVRLSADYADPVVCEDLAGLHGPASILVGQLAAGFDVTWYIDDFPVLPYTLYPNGDAPLDVIEKILAPRLAFVQSNPDGSLRVECLEPADWDTREPDFYITWGRDFVSQDTTHIKKPGYNVFHISNAMESEERIWADQRDISGSVAEVLGFQTPWNEDLAEQLVLEHSGGIVVVDPEYLGVREEIWPPLDEPAEQVAFEAGFAQVQRPIYTTRRYSSPVGGAEAVQVEWLRQHLGSVTHAEDGRLEAEIKNGPTDGYSLAGVRYLTRYHLWRVRNERNESVQYLLRRLDDEVSS